MFTILSTCQSGGYIWCRTDPPHPKRNAKGIYPLHRVLVENRIGRLLGPDEDVHHRDGNKQNNADENLELLSHSAHARCHRPQAPPVELACRCGRQFALKPAAYRKAIKSNKTGIFCSRSCGGRYSQGKQPAAT